MRALCLALLFALCTAVSAQQSKRPPKLEPLPEPPPPPALPGPDETAVNISPIIPPGHQVEELREGGRVVALKVTPPGGKPYFLLDTSGNGIWIRRDSLDTGLSVPMWPVYTFD